MFLTDVGSIQESEKRFIRAYLIINVNSKVTVQNVEKKEREDASKGTGISFHLPITSPSL